MDLAGKVAFNTSGGSGAALGLATVSAGEAGMRVLIDDIRRDRLDLALDHFRGRNLPVHAIHLDITDCAAYVRAAGHGDLLHDRIRGTWLLRSAPHRARQVRHWRLLPVPGRREHQHPRIRRAATRRCSPSSRQ
jgi:hypothetical protein